MHPSVFYKYTSANTASIVLESSRLRWSSPLLFNDVAEFQRMPRFDPTIADANALLSELIASVVFDGVAIDEERMGAPMKLLLECARHLVGNGLSRARLIELLRVEQPDADQKVERELRRFFEQRGLNRARVLCVTTTYMNDAMWGNYAESHTGCVLGFRHIAERSTPLLEAQQVSYCEDQPIVGSGLDFLLYGDSPELRARTIHAVCYTKKTGWSYEQEWRCLTWRPNEVTKQHGDYLFYPEELESVTLGVRSTDGTERLLRDLLVKKYSNAKLFRMQIINGDLKRTALPLPPVT
ncbi:DUF2971 domain-containing protein [Achromobacter aloeverae]|uniref:DUF2971 domain-containing protein n=2 Tax=Achromobacter aloeverae TaxID=1750518 RepID=A0A4V1MRN5_9BURK|nr:hypothetical protein C7R54_22475 [Achromobacter aloeverae]